MHCTILFSHHCHYTIVELKILGGKHTKLEEVPPWLAMAWSAIQLLPSSSSSLPSSTVVVVVVEDVVVVLDLVVHLAVFLMASW